MNTIAGALSYRALELKTWLYAALFIAANVVLPLLFHLFGLGGAIFVPILFFTLLASLRYGTACGATVAILSPLVSFALTGMPAAPMMWVLMVKGVAMAAVAGVLVKPGEKISLWQVAAVAVAAQIIGMAFQALLLSGLAPAWAAVTTALPGIVLQIGAVWALCRIRN